MSFKKSLKHLLRTVNREAKSYVSHHQTKQASMHAPRFGTQSKQSFQQGILFSKEAALSARDESLHIIFKNRRRNVTRSIY